MELRRLPLTPRTLTALLHSRPSLTLRSASVLTPPTRRATSARAHNERLRLTGHSAPKIAHSPVGVLESLLIAARSASTVSSQDLNALHSRINELADSALRPESGKLPEEQRLLYVLEQYDRIAGRLISGGRVDGSGDAASAKEAGG